MTGNNTTIWTTSYETPYEDFFEVKFAAVMEKIYIPLEVGVGVVGNFLCFITLVFSSLRATSTCVYMAAIAVLDCLILLVNITNLSALYMGDAAFYIPMPWFCAVRLFLFFFCIHFDTLLVVAMTADRFIVVKFPLKAQSLCSSKSAVRVTAAIAVFSFVLHVHILFNAGLVYTGNVKAPVVCWFPDNHVQLYMSKVFSWIDASIYSFFPFVSLLIFNVLIIRQLKISRKFSKQFTETGDGKAGKKTVRSVSGASLSTQEVNTFTSDLSGDDHNSTATSSGRSTVRTVCSSVRTSKMKDSSVSQSSGSGSRKTSSANTNITMMLLLVSFTFLVLTSPVVILLIYERYYWQPSTNAERARARLTHAFVDNLMYTNHAVNFLLYCISGRRFRYELKRLLARICRRG